MPGPRWVGRMLNEGTATIAGTESDHLGDKLHEDRAQKRLAPLPLVIAGQPERLIVGTKRGRAALE